MSIRLSLMIIGTVSIGLSGCGKDDTPSTTSTSPTTTTNSVTEAEAKAKPGLTSKPEEKRVITYRPVNAKRRLSGESIVIQVPDDIDIESGRMLEYRVGDDGKYYLRSVIPN